MKKGVGFIIALLLVALGVADVQAQCRVFGRFRANRQARIEARRGYYQQGPSQGFQAAPGGCVGGQCFAAAPAPPRPAIVRTVTVNPMVARR